MKRKLFFEGVKSLAVMLFIFITIITVYFELYLMVYLCSLFVALIIGMTDKLSTIKQFKSYDSQGGFVWSITKHIFFIPVINTIFVCIAIDTFIEYLTRSKN